MPSLKYISFTIIGILLLINHETVVGQTKRAGKATRKDPTSNGAVVSIYTSSEGGDRLTRKADEKFIRNTGSTPNEITVDPTTAYQKIEGFGATFNEAGMMCLNDLDEEQRRNVFISL